MSNITTCIDSSRPISPEDEKILEERFALLEKAHKHLIDPETGEFRTIAEAMKIASDETSAAHQK